MLIDFSDKTALITGATRGIGKAIADSLYESGATLILTGTNAKQIKRLNKERKTDKIKYFNVDFSNQKSLDSFLNRISNFHIDILVNNAGINYIDNFIATTAENFNSILDVNLKAPYELAKFAAKKMIENKYGRIINIASIWSVITRPGRSLYTASKNALHGLTQTMAVELAKYNILVNSVSPGFTLTELTMRTNTEEEIKKISEMIPAKRMALPEEIANTVLFLASDKNSYMTGQNLIIDGGYVIV